MRFIEVQEISLVSYVDSDWGGSAEDVKSTTIFVSLWNHDAYQGAQRSKKQLHNPNTTDVKHVNWLRKLLCTLGMKENNSTILHVDNQAAIIVSQNPVKMFHGKTK